MMKKFYSRLLCFIFIAALLLAFVDYLSIYGNVSKSYIEKLTRSEEYDQWSDGIEEIVPAIHLAQTEDGTTKLILGDSVCRQMINGLQEQNPDFKILGTNAAISVAGQYILAKEYLDYHSDATDVYLVLMPRSMGKTYDNSLGYPYAVMPFSMTDTLDDLDEDTIKTIRKTYGGLFVNKKAVEWIHQSALNKKIYFNFIEQTPLEYKPSEFLELANQYIPKMAELCESKGVTFHLVPCPITDQFEEELEGIREEYVLSPIYQIAPSFIDDAIHFPSEQTSDGIHFTGEYENQEYYNTFLEQMWPDESLVIE